jgi:hypothetical protein
MSPLTKVIFEKLMGPEILKSAPNCVGEYLKVGIALTPTPARVEIFSKHLLRAELEILEGLKAVVNSALADMEAAPLSKATKPAPKPPQGKLDVTGSTDKAASVSETVPVSAPADETARHAHEVTATPDASNPPAAT